MKADEVLSLYGGAVHLRRFITNTRLVQADREAATQESPRSCGRLRRTLRPKYVRRMFTARFKPCESELKLFGKVQRTMKTLPFTKIAAALLLVIAADNPARATISFVDMFRNNNYVQTGDGAAAYDASFLTLNVFSSGGNEFASVQAIYPGPASPVPLTQNAPTIYGYSTSFLASQAAMDAAYPTGIYQFNTTGAGGPLSTSFAYTANAFPQTVPFLAGTNYSSLQGMNVTSPFTFQLSPFTPGGLPDNKFLFLTVFETVSGNVAYDFAFQPFTTTSLTLPANTLISGMNYTYQLIFSDRLTAASPGADFPAQIGFDKRTVGSFSTATPEPCAGVLMLAGSAALLLKRRRVA